MTDKGADALQQRIKAVSADLEILAGPGDGFRVNEPMKKHTSFNIGGPADVFVIPRSTEVLQGMIRICRAEDIPCHIIGNGTNIIVGDNGIRGVVIRVSGNFCNYAKIRDYAVEAGAGMLLTRLSSVALEESLSGLEFASGIPGTVGGAIFMNAGAYGGEMKDIVEWTQYMDENGDIRELSCDEHNFGYRTSFFEKNGGIILKTRVRLKPGEPDAIKSLMGELTKRRKKTQPLDMPSAGSVFKRAPGYYTWNLIEGCNLRGYSIGGAQVSEKHCGFIVNTGSATASDVIRLIDHIRECIMRKFEVDLQPEVKIIGER